MEGRWNNRATDIVSFGKSNLSFRISYISRGSMLVIGYPKRLLVEPLDWWIGGGT